MYLDRVDDCKRVLVLNTARLTAGDYRPFVAELERAGYEVTVVCGTTPIVTAPPVSIEFPSKKRPDVKASLPYSRRFDRRKY